MSKTFDADAVETPKYDALPTEQKMQVAALARTMLRERMEDSGIAGIEGALEAYKEKIASTPELLDKAAENKPAGPGRGN